MKASEEEEEYCRSPGAVETSVETERENEKLLTRLQVVSVEGCVKGNVRSDRHK